MAGIIRPDPYAILGVPRNADTTEIRKNFKYMALQCHPNTFVKEEQLLKAQKLAEFQQLVQAYELLSDDRARSKYDERVRLAEHKAKYPKQNPRPRSSYIYDLDENGPRKSSKLQVSKLADDKRSSDDVTHDVVREEDRSGRDSPISLEAIHQDEDAEHHQQSPRTLQ